MDQQGHSRVIHKILERRCRIRDKLSSNSIREGAANQHQRLPGSRQTLGVDSEAHKGNFQRGFPVSGIQLKQ